MPEQAVTEGIAAAVAAARQLPATVATELLDTAGRAFTTGLNVVAGVGAVGFLVLALLTARVLRDTAGGPASEAGTAPAAQEPADDLDLVITATR